MTDQSKKTTLVVLAAGMGSRYGGLKQMDPVGPCGQSIIDYSVYDARRAGFDRVIFIIKKEIDEDFRRLVGDRIARGIEVDYAYQELNDLPEGYQVPQGRTKPWGTTHAVLATRHLIDGPFAVINADDYYGPEAFRLIHDFLCSHEDTPTRRPYAMAGYLLGNTVTENGGVSRGVCRVAEDGMLVSVTECHGLEKEDWGARFSKDGGATWQHLSGDTLVSMNFWGFQRSLVDEALGRLPAYLDGILAENPEKGECYLPMLVSDLVEEGRATVQVLPSHDKWHGVTYQSDRPTVVQALAEMTQQGLYPENLWNI